MVQEMFEPFKLDCKDNVCGQEVASTAYETFQKIAALSMKKVS